MDDSGTGFIQLVLEMLLLESGETGELRKLGPSWLKMRSILS